ncbi:MAG TPA: YopX family protein [Puia sp.]|jgi:uncharacterized phage protein (TIGR01671 family)|nr:YopX family protein [Puia sp.]
MYREIKFRAWDTYNERMVPDPHRFQQNTDQPSEDPRFNASWQFTEDWRDEEDGIWRPCHIMQFTGLKDKNGKEIYEEDIIEYSHRTLIREEENFETTIQRSVVIFRNGWFQAEDNDFGWEGEGLIHLEESAVVGNRFENPELLPSSPSR